ncbi:hypothetical protein [Shewanella halotolerans]|uniref:hypothetical protein n=1 Tax=Shewanella halotolerans TaxID=2864204 RepID=UPI001C65D676|nr:hypothetical protein [Shewanella halotolerans]QYJ90934.1 hypothetical protein K0H81_04875 [Shewanella halotolerans]
MEPSAYLDAMGITRWVEKGAELPLYHILVDRGASVSGDHPLIRQVLALFPEQDKQVVVSDSLSSTKEVFWDMRSLRLPKVACAISSAPITVLEQESKAKRELWQHIWESDAYDANA